MYDLKSLADTITLLRGGLAVLFIWLGANGGRDSLPLAVGLLLLCWTGDFIDGGIAHRSQNPRHTWIGDRDMDMDIFVSICLGMYLVLAGFIALPWVVGYAALWTAIFWLSGLNHALLELVQAPIYAAMIAVALVNALPSGLLLVGWIMLALWINRSRFAHQIVQEFLNDMHDALHWSHRR
jgi:hypothetical protein